MYKKESEELLDLVSKHDQVIGRLSRKEVYQKELNNFRTINAFIVNKKNQVWLPVRHHSKKLWPKMLDTSIGGHVTSGETYFEAFRREALEEVRLDIMKLSWKLIAKLVPTTQNVSSFMHFYVVFFNEEKINYNPKDFIDGDWLDIDHAQEFITSGAVKAKPDLLILIRLFSSFSDTTSHIK